MKHSAFAALMTTITRAIIGLKTPEDLKLGDIPEVYGKASYQVVYEYNLQRK